jgi:probable HAF family extracellular repeat protein
VTCLLVPGAALAQQSASFQGLGYGPGNQSVARGISADGSTVVGYAVRPHDSDSTGEVPVRWTSAQGMQQLTGFGPFEEARAQAVSGDGSVIVGNSPAFLWTSAGGPGPIPGMDLPLAFGVSADGSTVVGYYGNAFRWTAATGAQSLGVLPGQSSFSEANGVNRDGSVVVGSSDSAAGHEAFRWTAVTGMRGVGDLPGSDVYSEATAVSGDGSTVVGRGLTDNGFDAFAWTESGGLRDLGRLSPTDVASSALAVNADGSVVGGTSNDIAFVWTPAAGMRSVADVLQTYGVTPTGWHLSRVEGISADGFTLAGTGTDPTGHLQAWVAVLPEPSSGVAVLAAATLLLVRRRPQPWLAAASSKAKSCGSTATC